MLIMHRLHEDDLAGHVLAQEEWEVVRLPAIAEADERHRVETVFGRQVFGRRAGEALHPEREPPEMLEPTPLGGGMVKAVWFKSYAANERPEEFDRRRPPGANPTSKARGARHCAGTTYAAGLH